MASKWQPRAADTACSDISTSRNLPPARAATPWLKCWLRLGNAEKVGKSTFKYNFHFTLSSPHSSSANSLCDVLTPIMVSERGQQQRFKHALDKEWYVEKQTGRKGKIQGKNREKAKARVSFTRFIHWLLTVKTGFQFPPVADSLWAVAAVERPDAGEREWGPVRSRDTKRPACNPFTYWMNISPVDNLLLFQLSEQ